MQYTKLAATAILAGTAVALPQGFDWAAIEDPTLEPVPSADIPVVSAAASATTLSFEPSAAASSVSSAIQADPTDTSLRLRKRVDNSACGANAPQDGDTAEAFLANTAYPAAASNAPTPAGYTLAYQAQQGSSQGVYGYMGYSVLDTYDTQVCSSRCDAVQGCVSFNICRLA